MVAVSPVSPVEASYERGGGEGVGRASTIRAHRWNARCAPREMAAWWVAHLCPPTRLAAMQGHVLLVVLHVAEPGSCPAGTAILFRGGHAGQQQHRRKKQCKARHSFRRRLGDSSAMMWPLRLATLQYALYHLQL